MRVLDQELKPGGIWHGAKGYFLQEHCKWNVPAFFSPLSLPISVSPSLFLSFVELKARGEWDSKS